MWPPPPPIVAVPASTFADLRGRRVIVGGTGGVFRTDLRADNAIVQRGRTLVPVLAEHDYYRAELQQVHVFAALVPLDQVWVEDPRTAIHQSDIPQSGPPARLPIEVRHAGPIIGRRIVRAVPDGYVRDLRATSEVSQDPSGRELVQTSAESDWYAWGFTGRQAPSEPAEAECLWVE